jgi:shikimate kinase
MNKSNVSLTGFMGSGKSTVGRILSLKLGKLFVDLDEIIEISLGRKITEIFQNSGEKYFRDAESNVIEKIYLNSGCVFSCGGGVILRDKNMQVIKANSAVIYLDVSAINAVERLKHFGDRPLLQSEDRYDRASELLSSRIDLYRKYSDFIADTNGMEPEEVAKTIISYYKTL